MCGLDVPGNVKDPPPLMAEAANTTQPTSLLVTFLQYSSIVIQDTKGQTRLDFISYFKAFLICYSDKSCGVKNFSAFL